MADQSGSGAAGDLLDAADQRYQRRSRHGERAARRRGGARLWHRSDLDGPRAGAGLVSRAGPAAVRAADRGGGQGRRADRAGRTGHAGVAVLVTDRLARAGDAHERRRFRGDVLGHERHGHARPEGRQRGRADQSDQQRGDAGRRGRHGLHGARLPGLRAAGHRRPVPDAIPAPGGRVRTSPRQLGDQFRTTPRAGKPDLWRAAGRHDAWHHELLPAPRRARIGVRHQHAAGRRAGQIPVRRHRPSTSHAQSARHLAGQAESYRARGDCRDARIARRPERRTDQTARARRSLRRREEIAPRREWRGFAYPDRQAAGCARDATE